MNATTSLLIIAIYFALILVISHLTSRNAKSGTFFNGDRNSPWFVVAFGTIGATISGVTFVSVPGEVGVKGWHYLQFLLGNFVGYWAIALLLIPIYYKLRLVSIYDYLRQRFGKTSHRTGALFFMLSQMIGASFRLFLVVGVLQILVFDALNIPFVATAAISLAMIWLYIRRAGIKTVIWTDTLQTTAIIVAVGMTAFAIMQAVDISAAQLPATIINHATCDIFDWDWRSSTNFFKQFAAGVGIVIVMNGLDQNMMQKSLTCRSKTDAQKNIFWFSGAFIIVNILFLALGTLLYVYAEQMGVDVPTATDDLFPTLVSQHLPTAVGIVFLIGIISAAYSSADSSLTALTTVFYIDILNLPTDDARSIDRRKWITIALTLTMFAVICTFRAINDRSIVSAIFTVAGYTYGPLLGLFAFGIFTKRQTNERLVPIICIISPIICFALSYLSPILFDGYKIGFELLLINGAMVFWGLLFFSGKLKA